MWTGDKTAVETVGTLGAGGGVGTHGADSTGGPDRHARALALEMTWLEQVVQQRLAHYFGASASVAGDSAAAAAGGAPSPATVDPVAPPHLCPQGPHR